MDIRANRVGVALFVVYLVLYGGFMAVNAFWPTAMEARPVAGINVAILYGFGLIVAAFALALLYGMVGTTPQPLRDREDLA